MFFSYFLKLLLVNQHKIKNKKVVLKMGVEYSCCTSGFFSRIGIVVFLVLFAGMMSGLTLGLMSMSLVEIEVLAKSGKPSDRKHAGALLHPLLTFFFHFRGKIFLLMLSR